MKRARVWICVLTGMALVLPVLRADDQGRTSAGMALARQLWPPEQMMANATDGIAKRYKLDARQEAYTRKLLTERVSQFLDRHDQRIWPLFAELAQQQMAGGKPDPQTARRIAESGFPIFEEAKREILRAQDEFREILNEEQKRMHDSDLKNLNFQLNSVEQRLKGWQSGESVENPLGQVRLPNNAPIWPAPIQPVEAPPTLPKVETEWERYVKDFIARFNLDAAQQQQAIAILKDVQTHADQYRKTHREELVEAERMVQQAQGNAAALSKAMAIKSLVNKPFDDWFDELKGRLDRIPTERQKVGSNQAPAAPTPAPPATTPASPAPANSTPDGKS